MQKTLAELPDEEARKEALSQLTEKRCPHCFDYDESGQFWCCYDSKGD